MTRFQRLVTIGAAFCAVALAGAKSPQDSTGTLYLRLGGVQKIAALVDDFVNHVLMDKSFTGNPKVAEKFSKLTPAGVKYIVTEQLCSLTGGPQNYTGRSMRDSHRDLGITEEQWNAAGAQFKQAMDRMNVREREQNDMLAVVMGLKTDIVAHEDAKPVTVSMDTQVDPNSLYARLGGIQAIAAVVDEFVNRLVTDPVVMANPKVVEAAQSGRFTPAGLKFLVTEQLAQSFGGPQHYTGRPMRDVHKDLQISDKEWDAAVQDLVATLTKFKVPAKEQGEIAALLGGSKADVVTKH